MSSDSNPLLGSLDKLPKIREFDAFPKTQALYTQRSSRGGALTVLVAFVLFLLVWSDVSTYIYGEPGYEFSVDKEVGTQMQINVDMTVAMKCHYLTIDVRDAVGDRLHISDSEFTKDGTTFDIGHAGRLDSIPVPDLSVEKTIDAAKKHRPLFGKKRASHKQPAFTQTAHVVPDGPACRIYGSMEVKKVTGNLHITTLGHGYWSWEHTAHELMNLSHVVHEFSFGPYFPAIAQPLDSSVEVTNEHFSVFQYFVSVVPTTYIDSRNRRLKTNQYSVTDYSRTIDHGRGVPGIFLKYDIEPLTMTVRERTSSLTQFLVRLSGILGGIWVCTGFAFRVTSRLGTVAAQTIQGRSETPEAYAASYSQRPSYSEKRSSSGGWLRSAPSAPDLTAPLAGMREKATNAWGNMGMGHRKVDSVQQRVMSEEGRAW